MKRGLCFTIVALLGLLASVAMAMDNNWRGAAFGCVAAGCLFVMAVVWERRHRADHGYAPNPTGLLRPRRRRPPKRRAAEERDELPALHSITSSARASRVGGTSKPSALAVLRLISNSSFVDCSIGNSPGLAPLKILST
jgi:hypothetical protein